MRVDAHIPSGTRQTFMFSIRDVFIRYGVDIFFRQTEICTRTEKRMKRHYKINDTLFQKPKTTVAVFRADKAEWTYQLCVWLYPFYYDFVLLGNFQVWHHDKLDRAGAPFLPYQSANRQKSGKYLRHVKWTVDSRRCFSYQLQGNEKDVFQRESPTTQVKEVFQTGTH